MLFVSRQNNTKNKEVNNNVHGRTCQYRCAYVSKGAVERHETISHGPFFSTRKTNTRWSPKTVMLQAILMTYDPSASLKDRFHHARQTLIEMFPSQKRPGQTYQGYIKALHRLPETALKQVTARLRRAHRAVAGSAWQVDGWVPFAADGSRVEVPRTQANEKAFKCAGRTKTGPQLSVTTLYHMGSGLPWSWRIGPGVESERTQLRDQLNTLPKKSLVVGDAGFTGYDLMQDVLKHSLHFLMRVGGNVTLLTELGCEVEKRGHTVYLWPQEKRDRKPLVLRLIRVKAKSKYARCREVYLLTDVFDRSRMSQATASLLYRRRWGVEVFYRHFKQTLNQRMLRSRSPKQAPAELHWGLTALLLLGLMGVSALHRSRTDPLHLSVSASLRTIRNAMRCRGVWRYRDDLRVLLRKALKDDYRRRGSKSARDWPHKKNDPPPKPPKIRPATEDEKRLAATLYEAA